MHILSMHNEELSPTDLMEYSYELIGKIKEFWKQSDESIPIIMKKTEEMA